VCITRIPEEGIDRVARLAVSAVLSNADQALRQRARLRFGSGSREMPQLRAAHFADVSAGGSWRQGFYLWLFRLNLEFRKHHVKWLFFICLIIILTVTDLRVRLLPDVITLPGFAAGVRFSAFVPPNDGVAFLLSLRLFHQLPPERVLGVIEALLGAAFGSLMLWGAAALYKLVRKREKGWAWATSR